MASTVLNRLRVLRAEKRWSQAQLADAVGVSRQAINTIENGKHEPSIGLAFKLAYALDADINDVFQFSPEV